MKRKINIRRVSMLVFIVISLAISFIGATHGNEEQKGYTVIMTRDTDTYLTSSVEHKKLQNEEYQEKIAEGIVNGIVKYIDF